MFIHNYRSSFKILVVGKICDFRCFWSLQKENELQIHGILDYSTRKKMNCKFMEQQTTVPRMWAQDYV